MSFDVTAPVRAKAGRLSQYRLHFESDTNNGGVDIILCDWATPHLTVTYLMP